MQKLQCLRHNLLDHFRTGLFLFYKTGNLSCHNGSFPEYTQIAMLAAEVAMLKAVEEKGIKPDVTAGLSLGEYGALAAGRIMSPEDVFKIVRKRGIYMQEAVPNGGAMVAVLGLETEVIEKVCDETPGMVSIANYNCPGQIVITGEEEAVQTAVEKLTQAGAKRCVCVYSVILICSFSSKHNASTSRPLAAPAS